MSKKGSAEPGWICKLLRAFQKFGFKKSWTHSDSGLTRLIGGQSAEALPFLGKAQLANQAAPARVKSSLFPSTTQATSVEDLNMIWCLWQLWSHTWVYI